MTVNASDEKKRKSFQIIAIVFAALGCVWIIQALLRGDNRIGINIPIAMMWVCVGMMFLALSRKKSSPANPS